MNRRMTARSAAMTTTCLALLAVGAGACSKEPDQKVQSAQTELSKAEADAQRTMSQPMTATESAEAQAKSQEEIAKAQANLSEQQAKLQMARSDASAKIDERLAKTDAKAQEYKMRSTSLSASKKVDFDSYWKAYETQKGDVQRLKTDLPNVSDQAFQEAKTTIDDRLTELEQTVSRIGKIF